ncbi:cupin domain-containing protein [bacterium]|nr:cupin domain-containing protein [bacterium]
MFKKSLSPLFLLAILFLLASCSEETGEPAESFVAQLPPDSIHWIPLVEADTFESGCVALQPGDSGSEHSSMSWQEMLVVLRGEGEIIIGGKEKLPIHAGEAVYIPRQTIHQLHCIGDSVLQYVYVAAKTEP